MLQRLVELKVAVSDVLTDPMLTPKSEHCALLLKEKQSALAEELVSVLQQYEKRFQCSVPAVFDHFFCASIHVFGLL